MEKSLYKLKIDSGFKSLIRPLLRAEYEQLASNIIHDGCREPLVTWRGTIIDGHNRYEICHKFEIPFTYPFLSLCRLLSEQSVQGRFDFFNSSCQICHGFVYV